MAQVRVCIRLNSEVEGVQTFTVCNTFDATDTVRDWLQWAFNELSNLQIDEYVFTGGAPSNAGKGALGQIYDYDPEVIHVAPV